MKDVWKEISAYKWKTWLYPAQATVLASRMNLTYPNILFSQFHMYERIAKNFVLKHHWLFKFSVSKIRNRHSKGHKNNELKTQYFVKYKSVWYFFAGHDVLISCSLASICNYFCYVYHRIDCGHWQCYHSYVFLYCFYIFVENFLHASRICEH